MGLIVTGMHLSPEYGHTIDFIHKDGYPIVGQVETLLSSDTPQGIAKSMGLGIISFAQFFASDQPDILVILGDRFDMFVAAVAALPFKIPVAHIHGGETTEGAIDEAMRHSMTKMSQLHFVSTDAYARRVIQLGEDPARVFVSGALSLDNLAEIELYTQAELENRVGLKFHTPPVLVTYHPVTYEFEDTRRQIDELLAVLESVDAPIVFTRTNADTNGSLINAAIQNFVNRHGNSVLIDNLGIRGYFSLMKVAEVMIGNSSSGILEAPSFKLPVINIGNRQKGRIRADNVIDTGYSREEIASALAQTRSQGFREKLAQLVSPYKKEDAALTIKSTLLNVDLKSLSSAKSFYDL